MLVTLIFISFLLCHVCGLGRVFSSSFCQCALKALMSYALSLFIPGPVSSLLSSYLLKRLLSVIEDRQLELLETIAICDDFSLYNFSICEGEAERARQFTAGRKHQPHRSVDQGRLH